MYEYLKGALVELLPGYVVLDVNGVGYKIYIPPSLSMGKLDFGKQTLLFISAVYREDSQKLYGFFSKDERDMFEKLSDVSGIGPKLSLSIVGHLSIEDLLSAIRTENAALLSKIPGIGKKTAQRLIVDLKDRLNAFSGVKASQPHSIASVQDHLLSDGISALVNLGYGIQQAKQAMEKAMKDEKQGDLSTLIPKALQNI